MKPEEVLAETRSRGERRVNTINNFFLTSAYFAPLCLRERKFVKAYFIFSWRAWRFFAPSRDKIRIIYKEKII
jgi:hypothetical protein